MNEHKLNKVSPVDVSEFSKIIPSSSSVLTASVVAMIDPGLTIEVRISPRVLLIPPMFITNLVMRYDLDGH